MPKLCKNEPTDIALDYIYDNMSLKVVKTIWSYAKIIDKIV